MDQILGRASAERAGRVEKVQEICRERGVDVAVFTSPENIYYLAGLDYEGYFCLHALLVPAKGKPVLFARKIETPTILRQATQVQYVGYADNDNVAAAIASKLVEMAGESPRVALQRNSAANVMIDAPLRAALSTAEFLDSSGIAEEMRMIKSPFEVEQIKSAARISDVMIVAGIGTAGDGVTENTVAAEVYRAMISAGGQSPGFPPFIRSVDRLCEPHTTWTSRKLTTGDPFLLELSGCIARYHAPMARTAYVGKAPQSARKLSKISNEAHLEALKALKPGVRASDVHAAWKARLDASNVSPRLEHCGYTVGISFPPTWTGGPGINSLHGASTVPIRAGMIFHLLTWIADNEGNENFLSDCVLVEESGAVFLTKTSRELAEV
ncbi:M24 family metallopeptidase [Paraburkholderia aspalathi]|uniref:Xaa-Pro dipeptidase n=1 Tax=Paraburkholderia aspalathi TaxID=1324617 RepID=A0A1I7BEY5_9BURK|nr:Xaa-Pro peptidase family protein [Paraburkholderia aspalathi]SFT85737.1 Xaa-Pro dipeptidase [Paraburkholderia aspalathi]